MKTTLSKLAFVLQKYHVDVIISVVVVSIIYTLKRFFDPIVGFDEVPFLLSSGAIAVIAAVRGITAGMISTFFSAVFIAFFFFNIPYSSPTFNQALQVVAFTMEGCLVTWLLNRVKKNEEHTRTNSVIIDELNRDLKQQVNHLKTLIEVIPIGVGIANDPQCRKIEVNPAFSKISGIPPGGNGSLTAPKKERPKYKVLKNGKEVPPDQLSMQYAAQVGSQVLDNEVEIVHPSGKVVHLLEYAAPIFDELGRVSGSVGAFLDITERKKAEQELRISKERFDFVVAATNETVWDWDIENDTLWWNDQVKQMFGYEYDAEIFTPSWWQKMIHHDDRKTVVSSLKEAVKKRNDYWTSQYRFQKKNGDYVYVLDRGFLIKDATGRPIRMLGAMMDISEQKELEKRKDEFISIASHELKTPLTTIKAYTQILEKRFTNAQTTTEKEASVYLTKVNAYVNKLTGLIGDLLDVTKIEAGKLQLHKEEFVFDEVVYETINDLQLTTKTHEVILEGKTKKIVHGDKIRIEQVITNLVANAIKYSPNADQVRVKITTKGKSVLFSVQDFGIGIPKHRQEKIFQKFYRVSEAAKGFSGLGIGLYFSSEIVKRHHGKIWFESQAEKGTSFSFTLPAERDVS